MSAARARADGDGMCIFPAELPARDGLYGAPLDAGRVDRRTAAAGPARGASGPRSTVPRAPRWPTSVQGPPMVLAQLTARIGCPARVGERHTMLSWALRARRAQAPGSAAALYDSEGRMLCASRALWIELRGLACPWWPFIDPRGPVPSARPPAASRSTTEGREVVSVRGDARRCVQPRLHLPQGLWHQAAARGPRPADRAAGPAGRGAASEAGWDEAFEEIDRRLSPILAEHGRERRGRVPRQPQRPQPLRAVYGPVWLRALGYAEHLHRHPRWTRCPSRCRPASCSARSLSRARARTWTATEHLLMLGANPLVSNGSLLTAPDMRGRLRAHPRARRQGRGGRPAAHAHGRGGRRAPLHPARGRTRCCSRPWPRTLVEEGLGDAGRAGRAPQRRSTEVRAALAPSSRPRPWPGPAASRRRRSGGWRASWPRAERAAVYARIGTCTAGVRDPGQLAGGRAQRAHRQPRPRGRRDVHARGRRPAELDRAPAAAAGACGFGRWHSRVRGLPEVLRRAARRRAGRGDRHARRGPGARAHHGGRQPGGVHPQQRAARAGARGSSTSCWRWTST